MNLRRKVEFVIGYLVALWGVIWLFVLLGLLSWWEIPLCWEYRVGDCIAYDWSV
jgi:hypothetical protein